MDPEEIRKKLEEYLSAGKKVFFTSSFQTHSLPLLHMIGRTGFDIPVYFLNTGYLFPETIAFREHVESLFGLNVIDLRPMVPKSEQRDANGDLLFTSDPDRCCYLNKTQPLESVISAYDVWISGVRRDQNANRRRLSVEERTPTGGLRFHPLLDWHSRDIHAYIKRFALPRHPLEEQGYVSIGCKPCTKKFDLRDERESRWFGLNKTECGLHTDLLDK